MNTKGIKFLAVLAVLAMAFAACAVLVNTQQDDAAPSGPGTADSPLDDKAVPVSEAAVKIGVITLTPFLQPQTSIVGSNNTYTVYGDFNERGTYSGNVWNKVGFSDWPTTTKVMSFGVKLSEADTTNYYYVYQTNDALDGEGKTKYSELKATADADNKVSGDNPSFEIAVPFVATTEKTVTLKLIKSSQEITSKDDAKNAAVGSKGVLDIVEYTIKFDNKKTTISDSNAIGYGFNVKIAPTTGATASTTAYYTTLDQALNTINAALGADTTITVLADHVGATYAKADTNTMVGGKTLTIDLNNKTYTTSPTSATGMGGKDSKSLYLDDFTKVVIQNGIIKANSKNTDASVLIKSFATELELKNVIVDASGLKVTDVNKQFKVVKGGAAIYLAYGTLKVDSQTSIIGNENASAVVIYGSGWTNYVLGSTFQMNGASVQGDVVLAAETFKTGGDIRDSPATLIAYSGSINGAIITPTEVINAGTTAHTMTEGAKTVTINGLTVKSGEKLTIESNTIATIAAPAPSATPAVAGVLTNDGTLEVKGTLNSVAGGSVTGTGVLNLYGTLNVYNTPGITHQVFCQTNLYGNSTWTGYASTTGPVVKIGSDVEIKYVSFKQTNSGGSPQTAVFDIYAPVELAIGDWLVNDYTQNVNVKNGGSVKLNVPSAGYSYTTTIGGHATVTLEDGATIVGADANQKIVVNKNGNLIFADSSQYFAGIDTENSEGTIEVKDSGGSEKKIEEKEITGEDKKIDSNTFDDGFDVVVTSTPGIKNVIVPTGKAVVINAKPDTTAVLDVSAEGSEVTVNTGTTPATYAVKTGGSNTIYLEDVMGSLTFTKGSVEVDISHWTGGKMKLDNGADVKIFGSPTASADLQILMKTAGDTATVTIEADKEVAITFDTNNMKFILDTGVSFIVEGKLKVTAHNASPVMETAEKSVFKGAVEVKTGSYTSKAVDIHDVFKGTINATGNVVAYGTSDINNATINLSGTAKLSGKDATGGTWTFSSGKLTLTDYNGNYNFAKFAVTNIVLQGESKVKYNLAYDESANVFGSSTAMTIETVQGTGSLDLIVDISKTKGTDLATDTLTVFNSHGQTFTLDTVTVKVTVIGTNNEWTAAQIRDMRIVAIDSAAFTANNSFLTLDVMSSYSIVDPETGGVSDESKATGIVASGKVTIADGGLSIATAGASIVASGQDLAVSGSTFTLDAETTAVACKDANFSSSVVTISGMNAVVASGSVTFNGCLISEVNATKFAFAKTIGVPPTAVTDLTVRSSALAIIGMTYVGSMTVTSGSIVNADVVDMTGKLSVAQASEFEINNLILSTNNDSENNGSILITNSAVIRSNAKLTNYANLVNKGTMAVYGILENKTPGEFTNDGTFIVPRQNVSFVNAATNGSFSIGGDVRTDDSKAKLKSISITKAIPGSDGSAHVIATLDFDMKAGFIVKDADDFTGTIAPSQDNKSYTLTLSNGTATITIVYNSESTETSTIGGKYTVTASGVLVDENDETKVLYLEANKSDKTVTPVENIVSGDFFSVTGGETNKLTLTSGKMINNGDATLFASAATFLGSTATYEGALTTGVGITDVTLGGTFKGDLTANGTGTVTVGKTFTGDIRSKGKVTVNSSSTSTIKVVGDIYAAGDIEIKGVLEGDAIIILKAGTTAKLTVSGKMTGDFTYVSLYKLNKDDIIDSEKMNTIKVEADMTQTAGTKSFSIAATAGTNATTSASGKPGCLTFGSVLEAPAEGKNVKLALVDGMLNVPASVTIPERFEVIIEKDTTIEVVKGAILDVKKAALKVNKDAIANFETGTVAVTYGLVGCVMSFEIESGAYTIYSDVAYALTMCDEGAELTVTTSADIADNVSVKKGVNVIIDDKVTLDFKTFGLEMDEGAKFTLMGSGKVVFGQTGEDKTDDTAWEFFTISGTFVFDEGKNKIVFDDVRFDAAGAELSGKAATASADSAFSVKLNYSEGEATLAMGNATGTVVLKNTNYPLAKGADDSLFSGSFVIAADTVYEGTITDMAGDAEIVESIYTVTKKPTYVTIGGTFKATSGITVNGVYGGDGKVVLSDNKSVIIAVGKFIDADKTQYVAPSFTGIVVDTNVLGDEYKLAFVTALPAGGADVPAGAQFVIKSVKDSSTQYIALNGTIYFGAVIVDDTAILDTVTVMKNASITAETVEVLKNSGVDGIVAAKELKEKSEEYPKLGKLAYDATYEALGYTVYTKFANIDPELVSDITLTSDLTLEGEELDLSGYDINITIADGCVLKLKTKTVGAVNTGSKLIIGTPATSLGEGGSSITGVVVIDGALSYIVAYADVDLDDAEIYSVYDKNDASKCKAAVNSILDIEDIPYAALFANENNTVRLDVADKKIVPEIEGYNFTKWCNYDGTSGADSSKIGETNAYADFKAVTVFVTVKFVTGIAYYCNGIEFAVYDTPVKVEYNSVFTAKISDTSKYQGTPLVNGKNSLVITDDVEIVGSGVTPIPVPPEPEPEPVVGDSGLSLTDILLIVLVVLIAIMVVILVLRLNRS